MNDTNPTNILRNRADLLRGSARNLRDEIKDLEKRIAEVRADADARERVAADCDLAATALEATATPAPADVVAVVDGGNAITVYFSEIKSAKAFRDGFPISRIASPLFAPVPKSDGGRFFGGVVDLVVAAREFWDVHNDISEESRALDKALEYFAERVPYKNEPEAEAAPFPLEARIVFGLEAQGHIPAVEAALAEGADWQEIGRRIGWDGETAKTYYERHLARTSPSAKDAWQLPAESERPEGYRCLALIEMEWSRDLTGGSTWQRPDEHTGFKIEAGAPGTHGFMPLLADASKSTGKEG